MHPGDESVGTGLVDGRIHKRVPNGRSLAEHLVRAAERTVGTASRPDACGAGLFAGELAW